MYRFLIHVLLISGLIGSATLFSGCSNRSGSAVSAATLQTYSPADPAFVSSQSTYLVDEQNFDQAWNYGLGDSSDGKMRVVIIDGGIMNLGDLEGQVNLDLSKDFVYQDDDPVISRQEIENFPYLLPFDHGTSVTSVVAALHNEIGMAGVAPEVEIIIVRAFDLDGWTTIPILEDAVHYARTLKADVISMSWSGVPEGSGVREATYLANEAGSLCVAAAPNTPIELSETAYQAYPASFPWVIAVGGTERRVDPDETANVLKATFSAYGDHVDVHARARAVTCLEGFRSTLIFDGDILINDVIIESRVTELNGNSFATPQVAALLAIARSVNPSLKIDQVRQAFQASNADLPSWGNKLLDAGAFMNQIANTSNAPAPPPGSGGVTAAALSELRLNVAPRTPEDVLSTQRRAERAASYADRTQRIQLIRPLEDEQQGR
jgi:subtilisin family serine protease